MLGGLTAHQVPQQKCGQGDVKLPRAASVQKQRDGGLGDVWIVAVESGFSWWGEVLACLPFGVGRATWLIGRAPACVSRCSFSVLGVQASLTVSTTA